MKKQLLFLSLLILSFGNIKLSAAFGGESQKYIAAFTTARPYEKRYILRELSENVETDNKEACSFLDTLAAQTDVDLDTQETPINRAYRTNYCETIAYPLSSFKAEERASKENEQHRKAQARLDIALKATAALSLSPFYEGAPADTKAQWNAATPAQKKAIIRHLQNLHCDTSRTAQYDVADQLKAQQTSLHADFRKQHPTEELPDYIKEIPETKAYIHQRFAANGFQKTYAQSHDNFLRHSFQWWGSNVPRVQRYKRYELHEKQQENKDRYYHDGKWEDAELPLPSGKMGSPEELDKEIDAAELKLKAFSQKDYWEETLPVESAVDKAQRALYANKRQQSHLDYNKDEFAETLKQLKDQEKELESAVEKAQEERNAKWREEFTEHEKIRQQREKEEQEKEALKPLSQPPLQPQVRPFPSHWAGASVGCGLSYSFLIYKEYKAYCAAYKKLSQEEQQESPRKSFARFAYEKFFSYSISLKDTARIAAVLCAGAAIYQWNK